MQGIPNDSFLPLNQNIVIDLELFWYENRAGTQGEVKLNTTASVHNTKNWNKIKSSNYIYQWKYNKICEHLGNNNKYYCTIKAP